VGLGGFVWVCYRLLLLWVFLRCFRRFCVGFLPPFADLVRIEPFLREENSLFILSVINLSISSA